MAKKDKGAGDDGARRTLAVATHPRARGAVRRARAAGGLIGFAALAAASAVADLPLGDLLVRALIGGIVGSLVAWWAAVHVWRVTLRTEAQAAHARAREAQDERRRALEASRKQQEAESDARRRDRAR